MTSVPSRPDAPWLTVAEAAALADTSTAEVRRAVQERRLSGVSTHPASHGDWMFRRVDVEAWRAERRHSQHRPGD